MTKAKLKIKSMPRGELEDYVLLCAARPTLSGVIHGLGLRKSSPIEENGWAKIVLSPDASSYNSTGLTPVLTVSTITTRNPRSFWVDPEVVYIKTTVKDLIQFNDTVDVKKPISDLLGDALKLTLHKYYGFCTVETPGIDGKYHPAFVFSSSRGNYTALTITSNNAQAPGAVFVSYLQPKLNMLTFWRPTCFIPLPRDNKPAIAEWAAPVNVEEVKIVVKSAVLTFNAFNCDHHTPEDEDDEHYELPVYTDEECPYAPY